MTPSPFPPELVLLVVEHLPDMASLQNCALAASIFLHPCQKQIYETLFIAGVQDQHETEIQARPVHAYEDALRHLEGSPHLARYVQTLHIAVSGDRWNGDEKTVATLFRRLTCVRRCSVLGKLSFTTWAAVPRSVQGVLLEWILEQSMLEELYVSRIVGLPRPVFHVFLNSAPSILLVQVEVTVDSGDSVEEAEWMHKIMISSRDTFFKTILELSLDHSPEIEPILEEPEFAGYIGSLQVIHANATHTNALCFASARTLKEIHLSCTTAMDTDFVPFPPAFPQLRIFQLTVGLHHLCEDPTVPDAQLCFLPQLLSVLIENTPCPNLLEITINIVLLHVPTLPLPPLSKDVMGRLDTLFQKLSPLEAVHWFPVAPNSLGITPSWITTAFGEAVVRGLPKMAKAGKVVIDECNLTF
ncbi:hypothetical protein MIND_00383000 [Mycena indigotica]|uniref:Uncharacterized protein n=1 Tax=Mycena indigotica TaxID=2126181 RepID=A0A8H6W9V4_9AGAR|nr:uncharacterized protein MIND_00383000 [Mycena indigotica]KAF7310097.1 hypothetical protein MIND_00383000 [Mycena indigotica]